VSLDALLPTPAETPVSVADYRSCWLHVNP